MWCICKQDMPELEPFICLPFPSLKCTTFRNRALIKASSDFCPFLVRRAEEQGEYLLFSVLYLSLGFFFFLEWVCFADWNSKGRVDFSVPGTGRRVPGSTDLVMAMVAESCSILTELSCVHGQPMQAQEVWLMKKRSGLTLSF